MKTLKLIPILLLSIIILTNMSYAQGSKYKVTGTINIGFEGKWDYLSIDYSMYRLYVSHESMVNIIDIRTGKAVEKIKGLKGVHGIAFAPEFKKGFISEGKGNSVTVFDLKTMTVLETIKLDTKNPDAIVYDPFTKRIFVGNGGSNNLTAIDAETNKIVGNLDVGGGPEFICSDGKGKMYVNLEDKNEVVYFDPKNLKVNEKWSLSPCATPTGMAIDIENNRIFIGGRNKLLAVVNTLTGKVVTTLPIGDGVDACAYDKKNHLIFASNRDGTLTVIQQYPKKDEYKVIDNVKTLQGARTMALDEYSGKIYLSTIVGNEEEKTFGVLILDNK
jgi:YVTN family beta-propeller protein